MVRRSADGYLNNFLEVSYFNLHSQCEMVLEPL